MRVKLTFEYDTFEELIEFLLVSKDEKMWWEKLKEQEVINSLKRKDKE